MTFIGLENYKNVLNDMVFWQSFKNTMTLTVICIVGQIGFAFLFAALLQFKAIKFKGLHRTAAFLPTVFSAVVVGFIWTIIYDYNYGLLNVILKAAGKETLIKPWLSLPDAALFLVAIPLVWQSIGFYMVIFISAFSSVDKSILEMAEIDGASGVQRTIYIVLPLVKNTILVCVTLCIAGTMKVFDHIYVMTGGGPGTSTITMALYAYNSSFVRYQMGYGSAMAIVILILSLIFIGGSNFIVSFFKKR